MLRNSLDPDREPDPDSDFWLDPDLDSMNVDPNQCFESGSVRIRIKKCLLDPDPDLGGKKA